MLKFKDDYTTLTATFEDFILLVYTVIEALFEFVEDDRELDGVMGIFEELLKDADVELEK